MPIKVAPGPILHDLAGGVDWSGLSMLWTGWDGSQWELSDLSSGVQLKAGARGLGSPDGDRYTSMSPAQAGSRNRGRRTLEREVFWPLRVYSGAGSQAWLDYDAAFWATMHPDRPGVWSVTQPNGITRSLVCRFVSDGSQTFDVDPSLIGWQNYGVTLVAERPFWVGEKIVRSWSDEASQPFFGGTGGGGVGPPFYISAGNTISSARMPNPGDVDVYPVWSIGGSTTSVTVGVGDSTITYAAPIAGGDTITIDTDPARRTVVDQNGVDRSGNLQTGSQPFAPIPAGAGVPLSLSMVGTGTVTATIEPRYFRAW